MAGSLDRETKKADYHEGNRLEALEKAKGT